MLLRRQDAQVCVVIVSVIAVNVINLRAFKKLSHKCLGNKSVHKERLAAYVTRRSVTQTGPEPLS